MCVQKYKNFYILKACRICSWIQKKSRKKAFCWAFYEAFRPDFKYNYSSISYAFNHLVLKRKAQKAQTRLNCFIFWAFNRDETYLKTTYSSSSTISASNLLELFKVHKSSQKLKITNLLIIRIKTIQLLIKCFKYNKKRFSKLNLKTIKNKKLFNIARTCFFVLYIKFK